MAHPAKNSGYNWKVSLIFTGKNIPNNILCAEVLMNFPRLDWRYCLTKKMSLRKCVGICRIPPTYFIRMRHAQRVWEGQLILFRECLQNYTRPILTTNVSSIGSSACFTTYYNFRSIDSYLLNQLLRTKLSPLWIKLNEWFFALLMSWNAEKKSSSPLPSLPP